MYALFTLLAGACQSAMGSLNRMLTDYVGMFGMSLVVHAVGGILLILYMKLFVHEKLKISGMPWYLYSAGFFGIFLVVTSSYCIGVLGVSVVTCLSVTGQLVISAVIDHFGWFGVPRIPFNHGIYINSRIRKRMCHRYFQNDQLSVYKISWNQQWFSGELCGGFGLILYFTGNILKIFY